MVGPLWVRSEENVLVLGARRSLTEVLAMFPGPGKVGGPCLCVVGWTEEFAGDWWVGCVAGNGRVRLEELLAHWCLSSYTTGLCTNLDGRIYGLYATL